uniref:Tyrosine-protein phosphatase domain-containing protein n=1 Tax=Angiostrongylus cantonensis TaxID=6313 RepID=A0A0K0CX53_ANGCA
LSKIQSSAALNKSEKCRILLNTFWEMIWQENVACIVMLCRTIEDGKRKCFFFHFSTTFALENLNVVLKNRKWEGEIITSLLEVNYLQESRTITHHQWENWSDFKVPNDYRVCTRINLTPVKQRNSLRIIRRCGFANLLR